MEIADALYGVTMRDGVTTVVSQRSRTRDNLLVDEAVASGRDDLPFKEK